MKVTRDELLVIMSYCNHYIISKILPKKGKILYHSSQMLHDYRDIWETLLDEYSERMMLSEPFEKEFPTHIIDTNGFEGSVKYKDSIYYDGRVESIFIFTTSTNREIFLSKQVGKILTGYSYESFALMSIRILIHQILLPWLSKCYHRLEDLQPKEREKIAEIARLIIDAYFMDKLMTKHLLSQICHYLYKHKRYLTWGPRFHLSNTDKNIIRSMIHIVQHKKTESPFC